MISPLRLEHDDLPSTRWMIFFHVLSVMTLLSCIGRHNTACIMFGVVTHVMDFHYSPFLCVMQLIFLLDSSFLCTSCSCFWIPAQISHAPPGTQACTFDIKKFHRTCPVLPSHKPWLVIQGTSNDFFINHTHPFGAACASSNVGMIANAVVDIWRAEGVFPVPKYEDDLKAFRFPSPSSLFVDGDFHYDYDRDEMLRRISSLGVPWHDEKGDERFSFVTTFIGFLWDIPQKLVSLPEGKRNKFRHRVLQFLTDFDD